jgi:2-oxoisovalerate dehydrogenase E1 component alpha subunit
LHQDDFARRIVEFMGIRLEKSTQTSDRLDLLRDMYTHMLLTRLVDVSAWTAYQQGRLGYVASCRGHEAAQVGSAMCIEVGQDFTLPYYRDLGVVLTIGMTPEEVFRTYLQTRPAPDLQEPEITHARPAHRPISHWGYHKHNLVTGPAPVATQIMHAAGIAFACKLRKSPSATVAYCGAGATAEPDFREGITFAAQHQLPALFICEQDSAPTCPSILSTLSLPTGLHYERVDGSDVLLVYIATQEAIQRTRAGHGPTLLEISVTRATPAAALSDPAHDPLARCQQLLQEQNDWDETWASELEARLRREVERTLEDVLSGTD